ncbi:protein translocase subunit SecD [Marinimicrobium sp. C6131]|uniref:protein translocase subunit SecD n=1 Tax=Marinimicrobium sp. C6131 TaxID=3022676 RepID=UPI00223E4443|nr:protein translocase subunit SecD [Marinimicrobium sp. C6131]UZJ45443.1 protein translocase subunit SecD [Marinimicrobium sp. C6131]
MKSLQTRAIVYGLVILLGVLSALPNLLPKSISEALPSWYTTNQLALGLDLRGGSHLLLNVDTTDLGFEALSSAERAAALDDVIERSLEMVRRRLDETGLTDPTVTRQGEDGILVQLPGVDDPSRIRTLLGTTAKMTFHWAVNDQSVGPVLLLSGPEEESLYRLEKRVALQGEHIRDAQMAFNPDTGEPVVNFKLDNDGARRFGDMTRDNIGRALAVVLDGEVITAPVIRSVIAGGSGEISGGFTTTEASDLALLLRAGALPAPLDVVEERTVGPELGSDSIAMGVSAGLLGTLLVFGFMLVVYRRWGLIASAALALNIALIFGVLSLFRATLTLPGIAGIILSIGMAVDANILINERIREEVAQGGRAWKALDAGFGRAWATILDSNVTTLIAISLLFLFGSGPVRGFAVTMAVGLLTSLFTAIAVARVLMEWRVRRLGRRALVIPGLAWMNRAGQAPLNIMKARFAGIALSAVLSLVSIGLFVSPGLTYGVDFTGGSVVEVRAPALSVEQLRDQLTDPALAGAAIQEFGEAGVFQVRLPTETADNVASGSLVQHLKADVLAADPDASFPRVDMVGPKVSGDFTEATILAVLMAGGGMLMYLWFRFESHFALAATLTLALDLAKTVGFFALTGIEFNLTAVAALLALIGYSVNDKVVVFDRIRENLRLDPDRSLWTLFNDSISATLSRTLLTSITTVLAIVPMAIAGGAAVQSFAWPMLFGIVVGTSSSIFIAAPILYWLSERRTAKGLPQLKPTGEALRAELDALP